jgi:uncharacterized protein (TIGR02271 family)
MTENSREHRLQLAEEQLHISKRSVETGVVRIATHVDERTERVREDLLRDDVELSRVSIDREVDAPPPIRQEADVMIIPIVEERMIVTKRWVLVEELHVRKIRSHATSDIPVTLKSTHVSVERRPPSPDEV